MRNLKKIKRWKRKDTAMMQVGDVNPKDTPQRNMPPPQFSAFFVALVRNFIIRYTMP
jgi:hypothetical protein